MVKNAHHDFPKPKVTSWTVSFCPTNSPKPQEIQFLSLDQKQNHRRDTSEKLEPEESGIHGTKRVINH